ncbi:hypothetical protein [Chiayiivirga flava]|uniref:Uncharacterized protein n=1 Tax=Chiayiivirga flava TaxID=659595 RepID=A0A7W8FZE7_9GAMM|nr:hypothetical protein [Chiayiivirga flava]MBB5208056.1 hypothetical protein [Chiayiivirga flava]
MTHELDLDALRGRWSAIDTRLDASLELNLAALRASLSQRMHAAFRRHSAWLLAALAFDAVALLLLAMFGIAHRNEPAHALGALALLLLMAMEAATDVHAWRTLRRFDFDAPVLEVRARLAALRARRLRTTGAFILFSVALWWPFVAVLFEGLFGVDLYRVLHWSVPAINLGVGLLLVPLAAWIARLLARRYRGDAGFEQFLDDAAGKSWSAASNRWSAYADTTAAIARGDGAALLQSQVDRESLLRGVAAPLRSLRHSLWLGIALTALPLLAIALFNMGHGGVARFLVPGLLLHLLCIAHMVANIAHLHAVRRLEFGAPPARLAAAVTWMAQRRERLARWTLVLAPLFVLPAAVVLTKAAFGIDLFVALPPGLWLAVGVAAACASLLLARARARFAAPLLAAIGTGCLGSSRRLADALAAHAPADTG